MVSWMARVEYFCTDPVPSEVAAGPKRYPKVPDLVALG
jgi:hypothetical protein